MTKEQKNEAYSMRLYGATLKEVAEKFGVSREYIRKITPPVVLRGRRASTFESCVYPNLVNWLHENRYSCASFSNLCRLNFATISRALKGENASKKTIDAILNVTGMTYEVAFAKDEKNGMRERE